MLSRSFHRACLHSRNVSRHKEIIRPSSSAQTQLCSLLGQWKTLRRSIVAENITNNKVFIKVSNLSTRSNESIELVNDREAIMCAAQKKPFRRLPTEVVPYHYNISLTPDLENFSFEGSEDIHIEVITSTNTIVLNSVDIDIKSLTFRNSQNGRDVPASKIDFSADEETVTLVFPEKLPVGKVGRLSLDFVGKIDDKMKGFYRSKYTGNPIEKDRWNAVTFLCPTSARRLFPCWDEPSLKATFSVELVLADGLMGLGNMVRTDGVVNYAGVTQFEPTDARRCFPCWDEPAHKATFDITLKVTIGLVALSNMPPEVSTKTDTHEILRFQRTPIMSTYLVAVVVGEFDYVEDKTSDGVLVRVYTPKSKKEQGRFALEAATKVLPYYNEYFGISYPLPKMDLIAIADFSAGAMENWGLVTYRETCLLVDPENTSTVQKQWIALVVAHELAHQWFGNLVTMEWWTHLWLNEGYASFVEFLCVDHLFPEYDIWTQFVTDTYVRALELDGLKNSHPIEVPVGHPSEIDEIFDDISYNKGASVIRMLHTWIGDDDFRKGMNLYLKRHSYANAETEDLWAALEEASKKPVRAVMTTWTKQQGFPILKIDLSQENDDRIVAISQSRFLSDGSSDTTDSLWIIPISVSTSEAPAKIVASSLMSDKSTKLIIKNQPVGSWIKVNPGTIGFYRTRYSPEALRLIIPAIRQRTIPPLDRLGLLDDLSAMVQANLSSTDELLRFVEAFQHEDNYTVWSSIANTLRKIGVLVGNLDIEDNFKAFGRSLFKDVAARLGWDARANESHLDTLLRSLVLGRMAGYGDEATIEEAKRRFKLHLAGKSLPADLRFPVYRAVLSSSDPTVYESMLQLYRKTDLHEEKDRILRALGAIKDENLWSKVLEFAMSDEVRPQDTVFAIMSVAMSYKGRILVWEFLKQNWKTFTTRYEGGALITRLVKYTTENFVTEEKALDIEKFFEAHPTPGTERAVQQSIESIRLNAAWLARDRQAIENYLLSWQSKHDQARSERA